MAVVAALAAREVGRQRSRRHHREGSRRSTQQPEHGSTPLSLSLHELAASCPSLKRSCVLGFTRDGDHLLGYSRDADPEQEHEFTYALRLWRVWRRQTNGAPTSVASELLHAPLFGEARFTHDSDASDLLVTVGESTDQNWLVVVGVELSSESASGGTAVRHVSVLCSPIPTVSRPQPEDAGASRRPGVVYSSSDLMSPPFGPLDLEAWWLKPQTNEEAEVLVMNRGDEIDVFYCWKRCSTPLGSSRGNHSVGIDGVAAGQSGENARANRRRAVPLHSVPGCWTRRVATGEQRELREQQQQRQRQQQQQREQARCDQATTSPASTSQTQCRCDPISCACSVGSSVEHCTFHTEGLLQALFHRRPPQRQQQQAVRVLDYNMQLLQALDHRTISAVLVVSVSVSAARPAQRPQQQPQQQPVSGEAEERELIFLVAIDIADGSCGTLPFNFNSGQPNCSGTKRKSAPSQMLRIAEHGLMVRLRALLDFADYSRRPGEPKPAASRFGSCVCRDVTGELAMIWDNFNALDSPLRSIAQVLCHRRRHQKRRRQDDSSDSGVGRARAAATGTTDAEADPTSLGEIIHPYLPLALRWQ